MGTLELSGMLFSALYCWIITIPNSSSSYKKDNDLDLSAQISLCLNVSFKIPKSCIHHL